MTLLLWELGGLVLAVVAAWIARELTRPKPLYAPPIANLTPPTTAELTQPNPSTCPDTP